MSNKNEKPIATQGFIELALSAPVVTRAVKVAALVGTLLVLINHADSLFAGTFTIQNFGQALLTYLVPYGVSTWSAVSALRENAAAQE